MNQVARTEANLPSAGTTNPFESYGAAATQRSIVGTLLKFSKGDYLAGQNNDEIRVGTEMIANMDELMVGWIRWENNRPSEQRMGRIIEGYKPERRYELGDDDESKWDIDQNGQPQDPWQFSNYLILKDKEDGELYTFTTASAGGRNAIGELCKNYGKMMRQKPDEFPIVALKVDSYQHSNKAFGRIKFPVFEITGWASKAEFSDMSEASTKTEDEEIPF